MRRTKTEREEKEKQWQVENDITEATCESKFYIWNGGGYEHCPFKDFCEKHRNYKKAQFSMQLYELPKVRFYYVDEFRNCKFRNA